MEVVRLKCNARSCPVQVEYQKEIWFSWNLTLDKNNRRQTAYQIRVYDGEEILWDSDKILSDRNVRVRYEGVKLKADHGYEWNVRVWNEENCVSGWSAKHRFETGLAQSDWKAQWIGYDAAEKDEERSEKKFYCADDFMNGTNEYYLPPAPYLRKEIYIKKTVRRAKMYLSAFGLVKTWLNGKAVRHQEFTPGLSDYRKTVYSRAYDVTEYLRKGDNAVGIILADGWYAGYMGLSDREWYGSKPRAMMQIELIYEDGERDRICTDETWKAGYGGLLEADIFQGCMRDARKEPEGWTYPDFDDSDWENVETGSEYQLCPIPHPAPAVTEHDHVGVKKIWETSSGCWMVEFYNYICGVTEIRLKGTRGSSVSIRHAEILNSEGELHLAGNRSARCKDTYILSGEGEEVFRPQFTYHGFRFARIKISGEVELLNIEGIQLGTAIEEPAYFRCSNEVTNGVYRLVRNTEKANLFEIPTDCTARDERLGWGMEGNLFLYMMAQLGNQETIAEKWNRDIWDGQREDGALEAVAPSMLMKDIEPFVGDLQSHHGIYMVYTLYKIYGNLEIVREKLPAIRKYFDFMEKNSDRYIRYAVGCDWLGILEATDHSDVCHGYGESSQILLGTAYYAIVTQMAAEMCCAVGEDEDLRYYESLYEKIRKAFRDVFIQRDGTIRNGRQGDYLIALCAGMIPEENAAYAMDILAEKMMLSGYIRWFGGTATTPYLLHTLKKYGRMDLANRFLISDTYPGIGYMIRKGSDTIWERWDAVYEDGSLHPQPMNAISHEGYASIGGYLVSGLAGIEPLEAGFRKILIAPGITEKIKQVQARYMSVKGEIYAESIWEGGVFTQKCMIPANASARIELPCSGEIEFLEGTAESWIMDGNRAIIEVGSGYYEIRTKAESKEKD